MRARPLASVAAGACLLIGLTGCEKPTPGVTVSSGSHSVHVESTTYCRDGQSLAAHDCVDHSDRFGLIRVKTGDAVAVDVDKTLADHGWRLVLPDVQQATPAQDDHHFAFRPDFSQGPILHLEIRSLDSVADNATVTGVWKFQLVQE